MLRDNKDVLGKIDNWIGIAFAGAAKVDKIGCKTIRTLQIFVSIKIMFLSPFEYILMFDWKITEKNGE